MFDNVNNENVCFSFDSIRGLKGEPGDDGRQGPSGDSADPSYGNHILFHLC